MFIVNCCTLLLLFISCSRTDPRMTSYGSVLSSLTNHAMRSSTGRSHMDPVGNQIYIHLMDVIQVGRDESCNGVGCCVSLLKEALPRSSNHWKRCQRNSRRWYLNWPWPILHMWGAEFHWSCCGLRGGVGGKGLQVIHQSGNYHPTTISFTPI